MYDRPSANLVKRLRGEQAEAVIVEFMSAEYDLLGWERYGSDRPRSVMLPLRAITRRALDLDARNITVAHNHPSGQGAPSASDIDATRRLTRLCYDIGIELCDHLIVTSQDVFSFRREGML